MKRLIPLILAVLLAVTCIVLIGQAAADDRRNRSDSGQTLPSDEPVTETQAPDPSEPASEEPTGPKEFTDVEDDWSKPYIQQAQELGLMLGVSETEFAPKMSMTRAMFVTVLYRLHTVTGGDAQPGEGGEVFSDVPENAYYTDAVAWGTAAGIVRGTGGGLFSPDAVCTREQAVVLMYRYASYLGRRCEEAQYLGDYRDAPIISRFARRAMSWAVGAGLMNGVSEQSLSPKTDMTRAQFAALAVRFRQYLDGALAAPETRPLPAVEKTNTLIWMDGVRLEGSYRYRDVLYADVTEFVEKIGGSLSPVSEAYGYQTVTLSVDGFEVELSDCWRDALVDGRPVYFEEPAIYDGSRWYMPAAGLGACLDLHELEDTQWNEVFYTRLVRNSDLPTGYKVPVLMYHAVSDDLWGIPELFVSPSSMEAQLKALVENGYTAITFEDLAHVDEIEKPVLLTFDDGYRDNYTNLFPLLQKYNVKATIFVITGPIGGERYLTADQMREMQASGLVSFQSHTNTHKYLDELTASQLDEEMSKSRMTIARITGREPFVLCYPSGRANALAKQIAAKYYQFGTSMDGQLFVTGKVEPFDICRFYIARTTDVSTFLAYCKG